MAKKDQIDVLLIVKQISEFVANMKRGEQAITKTGEAAEKTGQKAKLSWKSIAKWGGIATAAYGAQRFLRGAINETEDLGKTTLMLNRVTGMDVKTSSEWASMLKVRGQNARQAGMAFVKVSQSIETARKGTAKANTQLRNLGVQFDMVRRKGGKDAPKDMAKLVTQMERVRAQGRTAASTLTDLGVSTEDIRKGNTQEVVLQVADAFQKMQNPARRAALTQKLFGRTGRELMPVLVKGRKGIEDQLDMANKYGAALGTNTVAGVKEMIAHERELKFATMGVKVQLGTALMPVLLAVSKVLVDFARILRPLTSSAWGMRAAIAALTIAFVAYKVAMLIATISTWSFNAALLVTLGWIALVIVALIAIGVAAYMVVKHWGSIKKAAEWVWTWIKDHWKLLAAILLGPFAIAAYTIATHWKQIKAGATAVVDWVKRKFDELIGYFRNLPGRIGNWFKNIPGVGLLGKAAGAAGGGVPFVPGVQAGGHVLRGGRALVGERGPEVVKLPAGATVAPLTRRGQEAALAGAGGTIVTKVYLDRRQIAEAVGSYAADKLARR